MLTYKPDARYATVLIVFVFGTDKIRPKERIRYAQEGLLRALKYLSASDA